MSWANTTCNTFWYLFRIFTLWSSIYGVLWGLNQNLSLSLFILSRAVSLYLCVHLLSTLSLSQFSPLMHRISWSFLPRLCVSVFLSTPLQLSLPCFPALFFPLSFLLSHLVTRPLERSVEFPLSQRRGQSEPHKDPQWTPSALSSLHSVTAAAHTYIDWII